MALRIPTSISAPPEKRGPTMNVVDKNVLSLAIEMTDRQRETPHGVFVTKRGSQLDNFEVGIRRLYDDVELEAFGLWSLAVEYAKYGKLLSMRQQDREDYPFKNMMRLHRLLYATAMESYKLPFVGLGPKRTLKVMRKVLDELNNG